MEFETRAIHAGQEPDPLDRRGHRPDLPDLDLRAGGCRAAQGRLRLLAHRNPTRRALEECLASLEEHPRRGLCLRDGRGDHRDAPVRPGERVVAVNDVYGGTYRLFSKVYEPKGYGFSPTRLRPATPTRAALADGTRPGLDRDADQPAAERRRHRARRPRPRTPQARCSSSTTPSPRPYLQRPLELGADIVLHSTTKYLGGHSDLVGGFAAHAATTALAEQLRFLQNSLGAVPGPFDCLARPARAEDAGGAHARALRERRAVVELLAGHPAVIAGALPRAAAHPGHEIAARQMRGFGGMISFRVQAGARPWTPSLRDTGCGRWPRASAASRG